jgi:SAM-dependent methyltransferase
MTDAAYVFDDGRAYEDFMGVWSRLVGEQFLDWLAPEPGLRWADIGCGNGCSTEQLLERTAATAIEALDPSAEQLAHARALLAGKPVTFHQGDAMALPLADRSVDAAQMALVIFFVPQPARGLAEMVRITRPGGLVAAYAWDVPNRGQCWEPVWQAQEELGIPVTRPPSADVSGIDALEALWRASGLEEVEARRIHVARTFPDFAAYWATFLKGPLRAQLPNDRLGEVREATRRILGVAEGTPLTATGFVSAAKGRVPT